MPLCVYYSYSALALFTCRAIFRKEEKLFVMNKFSIVPMTKNIFMTDEKFVFSMKNIILRNVEEEAK